MLAGASLRPKPPLRHSPALGRSSSSPATEGTGAAIHWDNEADENAIESVRLTYEFLELVQSAQSGRRNLSSRSTPLSFGTRYCARPNTAGIL